MMHLKFPLPPGYFPRFELTPDETLAYKELVTDLVKDTRREYDAFVTTQQRHVDARKWKLAKSKDKLHLFKRRSEYGAAPIGLTGHSAHSGHSGGSSGSYDGGRSESETSSQYATSLSAGGFTSPSAFVLAASIKSREPSSQRSARSRVGSLGSSRSSSSPPESGAGVHARLLEPTLLAAGVLEGAVDDLVYAFHEQTANDTKAMAAFTGDDSLIDTVVLHTIKASKTTYLGLKWKLCRTPGGNRDMCFLEYVGVANDAAGQRYGFKVLESVQLRNCPAFADNSIIRTNVSFCYLFRESGTPGVVDVYMQGAFDSSGDAVTAGGVGDARSTMDMLLEIERCMEIAEAKKLADRVARQMASPPKPKGSGSPLCSICRAKPGLLSSHSLCQGCGAVICAKCRMKKVIVVTKRGVSSKQKIACCKMCLVHVKETSPFEGEPINRAAPLRALTKKAAAHHARAGDEGKAAHVPPSKQLQRTASLTETEYSTSIQSWQSSSVSSSYSDLDDSDGSPGGSQLVVAHKMPVVDESPRQPQYAYATLANGTLTAAPRSDGGGGGGGGLPMHGQHHRAHHLQPHAPPPGADQHRMGLYNQMLELQMQAERAYNLANQNANLMQQRQ